MKGILKIAVVLLLVAGAGYSVYRFVWPLVGGSGSGTASPSASTPPQDAAAAARPVPPASTPAGAPTSPGTEPSGAAATPGTDPRAAAATTSPPTPAPAAPQPAPAAPRPASTTAPPTAAPRPATPSSAPSRGGASGRALLESGDLPAAANAFQSELRGAGGNPFTIAIGLYCNAANVERLVESARDRTQLYVLPTSVDGRRCYRVVWGLFDTREAAQAAMGSLPGAVRAGDAATMPLSQFLR